MPEIADLLAQVPTPKSDPPVEAIMEAAKAHDDVTPTPDEQTARVETRRIWRCFECGWREGDGTPDVWGTRCPSCGNEGLAYRDVPEENPDA